MNNKRLTVAIVAALMCVSAWVGAEVSRQGLYWSASSTNNDMTVWRLEDTTYHVLCYTASGTRGNGIAISCVKGAP